MTTPTTPTLIGRLEALREQASGPESWLKTKARDDVADLLPEILAALKEKQ